MSGRNFSQFASKGIASAVPSDRPGRPLWAVALAAIAFSTLMAPSGASAQKIQMPMDRDAAALTSIVAARKATLDTGIPPAMALAFQQIAGPYSADRWTDAVAGVSSDMKDASALKPSDPYAVMMVGGYEIRNHTAALRSDLARERKMDVRAIADGASPAALLVGRMAGMDAMLEFARATRTPGAVFAQAAPRAAAVLAKLPDNKGVFTQAATAKEVDRSLTDQIGRAGARWVIALPDQRNTDDPDLFVDSSARLPSM